MHGLSLWRHVSNQIVRKSITTIKRSTVLGGRYIKEMQHVKLSDSHGLQMPVIGLGTWRASPEEVEQAVNAALECGYRHIDTAFNYNNEHAIGCVLKKWLDDGRLKREDLFITTKLPAYGNRAKDAEKFLKLSLERLNLTYVDLFLIHMPFAFALDEETLQAAKNEDGSTQIDLSNDNAETWKAMEALVKSNLTKSIGLSNFNINQVEKIFKDAEIKPTVLQVEMHAYLQQRFLIEQCKAMDIAVTAYAPLGSPGATQYFEEKYNFNTQAASLLEDEVVEELCAKYGRTKAQILLRHLIQNGVIVIPKSKSPQRIKENIAVFDFELLAEDMKRLNALCKGEEGRIFTFLFFKGLEGHPEYPFKLKEVVA